MAERKRLSLSVSRAERAPRVLGDREKIRQVLLHLLGNAIKFTPGGGRVELVLDVGPLWPDGALPLGSSQPAIAEVGVRVSIRDSGIGIAKEKQARIFDTFFQVDSSPTREYGGAGLGLALVKSYIEAQGGRVWVESEPGRGSCFTVTISAECPQGALASVRSRTTSRGVKDTLRSMPPVIATLRPVACLIRAWMGAAKSFGSMRQIAMAMAMSSRPTKPPAAARAMSTLRRIRRF